MSKLSDVVIASFPPTLGSIIGAIITTYKIGNPADFLYFILPVIGCIVGVIILTLFKRNKSVETSQSDIKAKIFQCYVKDEDLYVFENDQFKPMGADRKWEYKENIATFKIIDKDITINYVYSTTYPDGTSVNNEIELKGIISNGTAHLIYTAKDIQKNLSWHGVYVLSMPNWGDMLGYWMTNDIYNNKPLAFGKTTFRRI